MKEGIKSSKEYVYCVIENKTGKRVGQFYSKEYNALSKSNKLNAWYPENEYSAVMFELSNAKEIK